jgi:hypothetical protein
VNGITLTRGSHAIFILSGWTSYGLCFFCRIFKSFRCLISNPTTWPFSLASIQAAQRGSDPTFPSICHFSLRVPKISNDWETSLEDIPSSEIRAISQRGLVFAATARPGSLAFLFLGYLSCIGFFLCHLYSSNTCQNFLVKLSTWAAYIV